jgi:cytochrome aa3-600 menaquinol oxidase subunit 1
MALSIPSAVVYLIRVLFPPSVRRPSELAAEALMLLGAILVVHWLGRTHGFGRLWREWLTTVDHKRIGIMYLAVAILMLFRGGVDALMIRTNLAVPNARVMSTSMYDQLFTTHGTIMVFFMAMPFIAALFNIAVPLMIGARDVAFPRLNAIGFWIFAAAAELFNLSFIVGGSPNGGWPAYPPLTETMFNPGVGENYYFIALLIAGISTTITGINFLATILQMRAPGMTLMRMPLFVWTALFTSLLILFAFPPLTVALLLSLLDRLVHTDFFTLGGGGMPMMYVNLFWLFGHPEVYILILPAFGVFSEVVATFSAKPLFGYTSMVVATAGIMLFSYGTWVHHFFIMGAGPAVNAFFGLSTMLIAIPSGVKIFNWLFTMWGGRIRVTVPMLYTLGFIPTFVVGGATGVMLAVVPADYQFHNSYFVVAHFHNVLIGGTLFGLLAGMYYWWPKMFGYSLNERQGRAAFWLQLIGFWATFLPQYLLGLEGMTRRLSTYPPGLGWHELNLLSTVGGFISGSGFVVLVYNIVWSMGHAAREATGDPWDGRTLEWSLPSPAPEYNFACIPTVTGRDAWWTVKQGNRVAAPRCRPGDIRSLWLPRNTAVPFTMGIAFFLMGFGLIFGWWQFAAVGLAGVVAAMVTSWFDDNEEKRLSAAEIRRSEAALGRLA